LNCFPPSYTTRKDEVGHPADVGSFLLGDDDRKIMMSVEADVFEFKNVTIGGASENFTEDDHSRSIVIE